MLGSHGRVRLREHGDAVGQVRVVTDPGAGGSEGPLEAEGERIRDRGYVADAVVQAGDDIGALVEAGLRDVGELGAEQTIEDPVPAARDQALPLLVMLHSTGASGGGVLDWFRPLAQERRFAIIAPESGTAPDGQITWQVGDRPGAVTPDLEHVLACIRWVREHTRLRVDTTRVLLVGHSGGGSSAPYIASNRPFFTHIAVLHGGVFAGGLGARRLPVWLSTGERDRLRPPVLVRQSADAMQGLGFSVTFQVFPGLHGPGDAELRAVIDWWLQPS